MQRTPNARTDGKEEGNNSAGVCRTLVKRAMGLEMWVRIPLWPPPSGLAG